jgi:hypothetical protein
MAERERAPESDGDVRPVAGTDPADAATPRPEGMPRQAQVGDNGGSTGTAAAAVSEASPVGVIQRRGQQAAYLRQKLDEKAAATDELREALDELRQVLDVDSPPPAAASSRRRTRLVVGLVVVLAVTALVLFMVLDRGSGSGRIVDGTPGSPPTTPAATGTADAGAGTSAAPGASGPAAPETGAKAAPSGIKPLPWPGGAVFTPPGLTTSGPGANAPGTDVQAAADPDGSHIDVFERLLLDAATGDPLTLAVPTLPAVNGNAEVQDLQVQLDDTVAAVTADGPESWSATPAAGQTYTRVTLRYRMAAGVMLVTPAAPGRALGIVAPLTGMISSGRGHPVQVRALGPKVLGITCPTAPAGAVCGSRDGSGGWVATVPDGTSPIVVLLQLNTSRSGAGA